MEIMIFSAMILTFGAGIILGISIDKTRSKFIKRALDRKKIYYHPQSGLIISDDPDMNYIFNGTEDKKEIR